LVSIPSNSFGASLAGSSALTGSGSGFASTFYFYST